MGLGSSSLPELVACPAADAFLLTAAGLTVLTGSTEQKQAGSVCNETADEVMVVSVQQEET